MNSDRARIIRDNISVGDALTIAKSGKGGDPLKSIALAAIVSRCIDEVNEKYDIPISLIEQIATDTKLDTRLALLTTIIAAAAVVADEEKGLRLVQDSAAVIYALGYQAGFAASLEEE